jgi:hypothetical protein
VLAWFLYNIILLCFLRNVIIILYVNSGGGLMLPVCWSVLPMFDVTVFKRIGRSVPQHSEKHQSTNLHCSGLTRNLYLII